MNEKNKVENMNEILIISPGNRIKSNEAWSKEIKDLSTMIPCKVLTCGDIDRIYKKENNYIILRNHFVFYPLFCILTYLMSSKYDTVLLECSPQTNYFNILLRLINKNKVIYRVKTYSWIDPDEKISDKIYLNIKDFKAIIVNTKKGYEEMCRYLSYNDLPTNKIFLMIPGIDIEKYPYYPYSAATNPTIEPFKILFASAPLSNHEYPEIFEIKGINILLRSIKYIVENLNYNIKLCLLWRDIFTNEIEELVVKMGLKNHVEIINKDVNIVDYYKECHATIFPATSTKHSPDFPSTIMESLCVGRPVIVSNILEISDIIKDTKSGVICEPNEKSLTIAIQELIRNYQYYAENCIYIGQSKFSINKNIIEFKNIIKLF